MAPANPCIFIKGQTTFQPLLIWASDVAEPQLVLPKTGLWRFRTNSSLLPNRTRLRADPFHRQNSLADLPDPLRQHHQLTPGRTPRQQGRFAATEGEMVSAISADRMTGV